MNRRFSAVLLALAAAAMLGKATACVPAADPGACDDGSGASACAAVSGYSEVHHLTVSGTGLETIGACLYVFAPSGAVAGDVVTHRGGTGTTPWTKFNAAHTANGLRVTDIAWDAAWEDTGAGAPGDVRLAAGRVRAALDWVYDNIHGARTDAPYCAQGSSGGSSAMLYALSHYGEGDSKLDHVMLQAATPFSRMDVACDPASPDMAVTVCPAVKNIPQHYESSQITLVARATHVSSCMNNPSAADLANLAGQSVLSAGEQTSFGRTSVSAFYCQNSPNVTVPLGTHYFGAANDRIALKLPTPFYNPDGSVRCAAGADCHPSVVCAPTSSTCSVEDVEADPLIFAQMVDDMKHNCIPKHAPPSVQLAQGALQGYTTGQVDVFKAIPYAAPPTGNLRWRAPAAAASWAGVRDATQWGKACPQLGTDPATVSEDCLFLNVWKPLQAGVSNPLPVMVFIHGGGGDRGSSSNYLAQRNVYLYDGQALAQRGPVVVVTLNYRLGALGELAHAALSAETSYHGSGNYGSMDQLAALQWVKQNIAAFGGDPARVTVFGESHGGKSILTLMASPLAKGLFSKAIVESGQTSTVSLSKAQNSGAQFAAQLGCSGSNAQIASCLRAASAGALIKAFAHSSSQIDVDGYVLTSSIETVFQNHAESDVPFIIGQNADEAIELLAEVHPFFSGWPVIETWEDFRSTVTVVLQDAYGAAMTSQIIEPAVVFYRNMFPSDPDEALERSLSDQMGICASKSLMTLDPARAQPLYRYFYTHTFQGAAGATANPLAALEATHGAELQFVFHAFSSVPNYQPGPADLALSSAIEDYWTSFAVTGKPGRAGDPAWPVYEPALDNALVLDSPAPSAAVMNGVDAQSCDFWNAVTRAGLLLAAPVSAPMNGAAVSGTVNVTGVSLSAVAVSSVAVSVDGGPYRPAAGTAPWTYSLDTLALANGAHTLQARAWDASGSSAASSLVRVTVANAAAPGADIGLRLRAGGRTVAVAAQPPGTLTSPLRITLGAKTYGIVLVEPSDPNASGLRVKTAQGLKALKKF